VEKIFNTYTMYSRAVAQAVSRRLPTSAAWFQAQVVSCWVSGGQSGAGAGFLLVLPFSVPIIPPTAHTHHRPS
jgi:hypothetical protein